MNGANKPETNVPESNDVPNGQQTALVDQIKVDQSNTSISVSQPPPHQIPPIQPLMNLPIQSGPPAQMQTQFNTPPPFTGFGMPPPNYMYPPSPWSMPWQQPLPQQMTNDKSRIIDPQVRNIDFNLNVQNSWDYFI